MHHKYAEYISPDNLKPYKQGKVCHFFSMIEIIGEVKLKAEVRT